MQELARLPDFFGSDLAEYPILLALTSLLPTFFCENVVLEHGSARNDLHLGTDVWP